MKETKKQLNDLLGSFYSQPEARQIAGDIEEADNLLASFESPMPRAGLADQIKEKVIRQAALHRRKTRMLRSVLSAAAACLLVGAGLILFQRIAPPDHPQLGPGVVEAFFSEQTVENITSNLDDISEQIYAIQTSGWTGSWETEAVQEIEEMDRLTSSDFWKG
jgi:hypothetical protein